MTRFLLAIILIEIPLQMDIYLFHREEIGDMGAIGGLNLSLTTICLGMLYALWIPRIAMGNERLAPEWKWTVLPLAVYLFFVTTSLFAAEDVWASVFELFLLLQAFLLFVYVTGTVRSRSDVVFVAGMLMVGLVIEGGLMVGSRMLGTDIQMGLLDVRVSDGLRVSGTIGSPTTAASYLGLLLVPAGSLLITRSGWVLKSLALAALSLGTLALVFTLSRGGWVAYGLSGAILVSLAWYRGWLGWSFPLAAVLGLVLLVATQQDVIAARLHGDDHGSALSRLPLAQLAFRIIGEHGIFGVGANNCALVAQDYASQSPFRGEWFYTIHNKYLLVWVETGIGGLVTFMWFLLATLRFGWRGWMLHDRLLSPLALGFLAAIGGQMAHMMVDMFNSRPQVQMLWLVAGLVTVIPRVGGDP